MNEIEVYIGNLNALPTSYNCMINLLSPEELSRAQGFYFLEDKVRFVLGRYILRKVLSNKLGIAASRIELWYTEYSKPILSVPSLNCEFNISHSQHIVLVAFASSSIGIDVEYIDNMKLDLINNDLALSCSEINTYKKLPFAKQKQIFYKIWTHKESYVKAIGIGLHIPLNQLEVIFGSEDSTIINKNPEQSYLPTMYIKQLKGLPPHYIGAVAFKEKEFIINYHNI